MSGCLNSIFRDLFTFPHWLLFVVSLSSFQGLSFGLFENAFLVDVSPHRVVAALGQNLKIVGILILLLESEY
jgi:hypothetical protein